VIISRGENVPITLNQCPQHATCGFPGGESGHGPHIASYQKSTPGGVDELGAFTQIGAFGLTGEWVFGQRTQCGMMAAPYGSGFPAMAAD